jgi:hypothetical protein
MWKLRFLLHVRLHQFHLHHRSQALHLLLYTISPKMWVRKTFMTKENMNSFVLFNCLTNDIAFLHLIGTVSINSSTKYSKL